MIKIKKLKQLKLWNLNPTEEIPVVWEWYADWIFDKCLKKEDFDKFKDAYDTMIEFTMICEKMNRTEAMARVDGNIKYWYQRASKNSHPFKEYFNKLTIMNHGI